MSIVKKFNPLKNLNQLDMLVDDFNESRHFVLTDLPESLPQGRSSFLIETGPFLKEGIELQIDFVDSEGNSIYYEPIDDYLEGTSRRISVEVYSDTGPGVANLIIVGELDSVPTSPGSFSEVELVPEDWQGIYNVRLTKEIIINPTEINTEPIRFYTQPKITVTEKRLGSLVRTESSSSIVTAFNSIKGNPDQNFEFTVFETEEPKQGSLSEVKDKKTKPKGKTDSIYKMGNQFKNKKGKRKSSIFKRIGHIARTRSPIEYPYSFEITNSDEFTTKDIGGRFIIKSIDSTQYDREQFTNSKIPFPPTFNNYTGSIAELKNNKIALLEKPFTNLNDNGEEVILPFFGTVELVKQTEPTSSYSTANIISYADVVLSDMRTFSGDVFKAKVMVRSEGSFDDFKTLAEIPVESSELMIDPLSVGLSEHTGYYENQGDISTYWDVTGGTAVFSNSPLLDGVYVSGSVATFENQIKYKLKDAYKFELTKNVDYTVSFNAYTKRGNNSRSLLAVYISGSSFPHNSVPYVDTVTNKTLVDDNTYGYRLGVIEVDYQTEKDLGLVVQNFTPNNTGDGVLQFRIVEGGWYFSDISVKPSEDTGFSPSTFTFQKEMPLEFQHKRPDTFEFLVEFYDANDNIADSLAFNTGSVFTGGNVVITGNDNIQSGDMFLGGDSTGSGIHFGGIDSKLPETGQDGATSSGFIRSIGYQGFVSASAQSGSYGFMIYSGSVLPNSGDNYAGVGLELVGASGSLKFRTKPSIFEVVADAFFVGSRTTQFISGSSGAVEISSSNFHLTPQGNVTMSGIITAEGGNIGDFKIIGGQISGSNMTFNAPRSQLFKTDQGPGSDTTAGFDAKRDEYYIDFTPSGSNDVAGTNYYIKMGPNFMVDKDGILIASGAEFVGTITASAGLIGGFTTDSHSFSSNNIFISGSPLQGSVNDSKYMFISTSNFNVKQSGDVTGSKVLFTGGKLGGFNINNTSIRDVNNTVELSSALPGLKIKDNGGTDRVLVKSGSLSTVGGGTQYIGNKSFEEQLGSLSAGRNFVGSINSWSFSEGGAVNISLTDRNAFPDDDKAVSGRVTLDVVVPAGSGNYSSTNTYQISQVVTASIAAGDTLSFSSVARFSSSFGGRGKDRALQPQYFRLEYSGSSTNGFVPFLPHPNFTASNGYGEYFLGSGQYNSFGASADLPAAAEFIKVVLTGSINDDTGFTIEKPLFIGDKGTVNSDVSGRKFTKQVVGSTTAEHPETEITFDNFSLRSNSRRVEMTQEGLLIYNSEDSFIKMTGAGIEIRGGSGVANFGTAINREASTNDSQVAGTLGAPALQAYQSDPEDIGTTASDGNVGEFAKGNHVHRLTFSTVNSVLAGQTLTGATFNGLFGSNARIAISGSLGANADVIRSLNRDTISGSLGSNAAVIRTLSRAGISGSLGANAAVIRTLTRTGISGSLGSNAALIRSLTRVGISGSLSANAIRDLGAGILSGSAGSMNSFNITDGVTSQEIGNGNNITFAAGTGLDVAVSATDTVTYSADVSDFMTNGANNRIITATGTDAMNAESNLTFDGSTLGVTGTISTTSNILLASGANLFFDGGSNSYIKEHSADDIRVVAGGVTAFDFLTTGAGVPATAKLYLDGGGNTHLRESSADNIKVSAGGTDVLDITSVKVSGSSASTASFSRMSLNSVDPMYAYLNVQGDIALGSFTGTNLNRRIGLQRTDGAGWTNTPNINFHVDGNGDGHIKFSVIDSGVAGYADAMVISKDGFVGIGETSPATKLHVKGAHVAGRGLLSLESTNHAILNLRGASGNNAGVEFFNGTTQKWAIANRADVSDKYQIRRGSDDAIAISIDQSINTEFGGNVSGSAISTGSFGQGHFAKKLGIGTTSPDTLLHIEETTSSTDLIVKLKATRDVYLQFWADGTIGWALTDSVTGANDFSLYNYPNNRHDITVLSSNGYVGIGDTSPSYKLDVAGTGQFTGELRLGNDLRFTNSTSVIDRTSDTGLIAIRGGNNDGYWGSAINIYGGSSSGNGGNAGKIYFYNVVDTGTFPTVTMALTPGGNVGIGTTSPGAKLTVEGDVSGSATSTGSFGTLESVGNSRIKGLLNVEGSNAFAVGSLGGVNRIDTAGGGTYTFRFLNSSDQMAGIHAKQVLVDNNIAVGGTVDGRDIASDGSKLDGIESGATADQSNAEIRAAVEAASDSNVFTDADHSKLNAIEASATADQTITAGTGLDGGGTGDVTLSVDVSDFMTNGSDNRVLTATGTDAMNAESNLIFDGNNLGIGTASPEYRIHTYTASDYVAKFESSDGYAGIVLEDNSSTSNYNRIAAVGNEIRIDTNNTERLRVDSSGNVGIGKTSLSKTLHVDSNIGSAGTPNGIMMTNTVHGSNSKIYMYAENDSGAQKNSSITLDPDAETMAIDYNGNALTIDSSGHVGIGISPVANKLHLHEGDSTQNFLHITNTTTGTTHDDGLLVGIDADEQANIWNRENTATLFATNNIERMRINNTGVGIGTSTLVQPLTVEGNISGSGNLVIHDKGSSLAATIRATDKTNGYGLAVESQGTANTRYNVIFRDVDGANIYGGIATKTGQVGFWGVGVSPAATLGSRLNVNGNVAIGNGYTGTAAPSNGMIVQGNVGIGTTNPYSALNIYGDSVANGNAKRVLTVFDTRSATTGTGAGIALGGYNSGTSGATNDFAVITGIKENSTGGNYASALTFQTRANGAGTQEQMRISSTGNIGIGVTSPNAKLEVKGATGVNDNETIVATDTSGNHLFEVRDGGRVIFNYGPVEFPYANSKISGSSTSTGSFGRVHAVSKLAVGTTTVPSGVTAQIQSADDTKLRVATANSTFYAELKASVSNDTPLQIIGRGGDVMMKQRTADTEIEFLTNNTTRMYLDSTGLGIGTTSPSQKLHVVGNAFIDGALTAREFFTDIVSSSIQFTSGSTKFGDSTDDTHQFTGSLNLIGSVDPLLVINKTGGANAAVHFQHAGTAKGYIYVDTSMNMHFGNTSVNPTFEITSAGTGIFAQNIQLSDGQQLQWGGSNNAIFGSNASTYVAIKTGGTDRLVIDSSGNLDVRTGNVSGSASSTGSFGRVEASRVRGNAIFVESDLAKISKGDNNTIRFDSPTGNVKIGSQNASYLHFYTDRGQYYFNRRLIIDEGIVSSYNEDLVLQRATTTKLTLGNTITTSHQDFAISDTKTIGTSTFISGITGDGFRIDDNGSDGTLLEIDNIVVRNTLRTHIFQKDVVKATNGILFISDSGVISGSTGTTGTGTVTFEDDKSATFSDDQIILFKDAQDNGTINAVRFQINGSPITGGSVQSGFTKYNVDNVAGDLSNLNVGGTAARISGGTVAIDASSPNSPFVDVNASSGSAVVRMGNLAGITSPRFGTLSNQFGLWASGSAYLEGAINAKTGNIGTWGIGNTAISSSGGIITLDADAKRITISDGSNDRIRLGEVDGGTVYGLKIFDGSGVTDDDILVELGQGGNQIAGWTISTGAITSPSSIITISSDNKRITINDGSNDRIYLGEVDGSTTYGLKIFDGTGTADADRLVELGQGDNMIVGWQLVPGRLEFDGTNGSIALDATNQQVAIYTGSINTAQPKVVMGKLPRVGGSSSDDRFGFAVFSGSENASILHDDRFSVLITRDKARLAGWDLVPGALRSGTVADINGNQAKIALGANANQTHTTPQANLFYVSASATPTFFVGENFSFINNTLTAAGWEIASTSIKKGTDVVIDSSAKSITLGNGAVAIEHNSGTPIIRSATNFTTGNGFFLSSAGSNNFRVGNASGARLQFTGTNVEIYNAGNTKLASLGATNQIGGFGLTNTAISSSNNNLIMKSSGQITGSTVLFTGGKVGGFNLSATTLSATNFTIDTSGKSISLGSGNTIFKADADDGIQLGHATFGSAPFRVTTAGALTATSATIEGTVTATAGAIGGFTIDADEIKSTNLLLDSTNEKITVGGSNSIKIQGGSTDNFIVMGTQFIGESDPFVNFDQEDNPGILLGMDNTVPKFELTDGGDNHLLFDGGTGTLKLKSQKVLFTSTGFSLNAQSSTNTNNKLSLGTITSNTDTTGAGFFADGAGNFRIIGSDSTSVFISGSLIDFRTNRMFFGATGSSFISASNGVLQISSSKFQLKPSGDVIMKGILDAESGGQIGGFSIGSATLTSTSTSNNVTATTTLTSGDSPSLFLRSFNSSTNLRSDIRLANLSDDRLLQTMAFHPTNAQNQFLRLRAGVGDNEGIPPDPKTDPNVPGMNWSWDYANAYGELPSSYSSGDPIDATMMPFSESFQILNASASKDSKNKGLTIKYNVTHKFHASDVGIPAGTGAETFEVLRMGKIENTGGSFNPMMAGTIRSFHYGISGSQHTTASFGRIKANVFVGDGSQLTGISGGGGGSMDNWVMSDGATTQTVADGQTTTFAAGEGIDVAVSATRTVTYSAEDASTSNKGVVELATTAETTTGTDTARAVTPDGLKDGYQGSTNVTTLGTISTGTWNGTAIDTAYLDTSLTSQVSIFNANLKVGAAYNDEYIDFTSDGMIMFKIDNVEDFRMADGGTFHANNDVIAFSSTISSDKKLKTNIENINYGLSDVLKLSGRQFDWKRKDRGHDIGFIAQEVEEVIPELVKEVDGLNGEDSFKTVDYAKTTAVLVEAIKEQQKQIEDLKSEIKELKDGSSK